MTSSSTFIEEFHYTELTPATTLREVFKNFDPDSIVDPMTDLYTPRTDYQLKRLYLKLDLSSNESVHAFLCGHQGSGKTSELQRLCQHQDIKDKFTPLYLSVKDFGSDTVHLTHDHVMLEIGLKLVNLGKTIGLSDSYEKEFQKWGTEVVTTFLHDEAAKVEVGAKGNAWLAFFKAQLSSRREWKREEIQRLEPKVQDLMEILNRISLAVKQKTGKPILIIVDDLEKGGTEAHRKMHHSLFQENYETLIQVRFSIIYTLPVYFRALENRRIPEDELYAFSAIRLYEKENKAQDEPPLSKESEGYALLKDFVQKRLKQPEEHFSEEVLDELLRIGGGLFRETARAIQGAAQFAMMREAERIEPEDVQRVYGQLKKEYQPIIRGEAIEVLNAVLESEAGWVPGIESFLQSKAVVEYENGDIWIDVRHMLKPYVRKISSNGS